MKLLSNIQERVERSIFEEIRLLLVEQGYTPDVTNYLDDTTDTAQFKTDLAQIKADKGFAVEIFGASGSQAKGVQAVPRIAMVTRRVLQTDVGLPQSIQFANDPKDPEKYLVQKLDSRFQYMLIEVQLVSSTVQQDRLLHQIVNAALGARGYLPFYDDKCEKFFIEQFSYWDNQNTDEGVMTKIYQFKVDNISVYYGEVDTLNKVSKIAEITITPILSQNLPPATDLGNVAQDSDLVIP